MLLKDAINKSFSRHAGTYARHAEVQATSAEHLAQFISSANSTRRIPAGSVLEIGCGTGLFTKHLLSLFADRVVVASDVSQSMLDQCRLMLASTNPSALQSSAQSESKSSLQRLKFSLLDADNCESQERYALVAASFSLQWVTNFLGTLDALINHLKPDGQLVFSVPLNSSFSEWREQCVRARVPFTGNNLPDRTELVDWCRENSLTLEWQQQPITCSYSCPIEFFRSLKSVGAATNTSGVTLTQKELRRLIHAWNAASNKEVLVTYDVLCARITRGYDK
jgi:malonyl-CoA O-methyltransferase